MKTIISLLYISVCAKAIFAVYTNGRVIGGDEIEISEAPYQVGITLYQPFPVRFFVGGGSILNKNLILTAAHLFDWYSPDAILHNFTVRVGTKREALYGQHVQVNHLIIHPNYNKSNSVAPHDYDIAILQLDTSLDLNPNLNTEAIKLPPFISFEAGVPVDVTGWGDLVYHSDNVLTKITIHILDSSQCKSIYQEKFTERMLCAADIDWQKHACTHDEGGPMVLQGTNLLLGVVSFGTNCTNLPYPTVFTNVAHPEIQSWIRTSLESLKS